MYEPLPFFLLRAPLLPVASYLDLHRPDGGGAHVPAAALDPVVRRALAVGSLSLSDALARGAGARNAERRDGKLLRYLIRMSTRPTPFGLFAGVALGHWGERTDLALAATAARTRTRLDMGWLYRFVLELEARPEVRRHLRLVANPAALVRAGRVWLAELAPGGADGPPRQVSVRATGAVLRALAAARRPIPYGELAAELLAAVPGATPARVEALLTALWEQTLLLTDLRPPLTTGDPAGAVADRLRAIPAPAAAAALTQLESLRACAEAFDRLPPAPGLEVYRDLLVQAGVTTAERSDPPLQVDTAHRLAGRAVTGAVAAEVARAADLLLRLSPHPRGLPYLSAYRQAFLARYGQDREVPLLELLDPRFGLGPPFAYGNAAGGLPPATEARRRQALLELAGGALREGRRAVELDAELLSRLETGTAGVDAAPVSLDLYAFVVADSAAAVDAGRFQVVVAPNVGARAAGRSLGRFADLLGPEARAALDQAARAEEQHAPDCIWAELVYWPRRPRSANVAVRPAVRRHEIALAVGPGVTGERVIPLDELVVGVRAGRFYLRWPEGGAEVIVCAGHMLNNLQAPAVCRFLADLGQDGRAQLTGFDWGPAAGFPFLPRVQAGRVVLRPAEWRIGPRARVQELAAGAPGEFRAPLDRWRSRWGVPRHVYLTMSDNRLLLDLDDDRQVEELRHEVRRLRAPGHVLLQEALPGPGDAWLPGPGGRYLAEFVVPLVRRAPAPPAGAAAEAAGWAPAPAAVAAARPAVAPAIRLRPPGSDWLFVKLYAPVDLEADLIAGPVSRFAAAAVDGGLAAEWFFIRYADPEPHLRLRWRGEPGQLTRRLLPAVAEWAAGLVAGGQCQRVAFDTYEREVERYGGPAAMAAAESLFAADSRAVAALLGRMAGWPDLDLTALAVYTADDLLAALGLGAAERLAWLRRQVPSRHETGAEYARRKQVLRRLLGSPVPPVRGGEELAAVLAARREALGPVREQLAALAVRGELAQPLASLYSSFVHMHCNRLLGTDRAAERQVLGLWLRTRTGLDRAPLPDPS